MADIIDTNTGCSEETSFDNPQELSNSNFLGYTNTCNLKKPKRKSKKKYDSIQLESADSEDTNEKTKNMVEENRNGQVDSVFKDDNEDDHYSSTNEIHISNIVETLPENKTETDFKEIVETENEVADINENSSIINVDTTHSNTDQHTDFNSLNSNENKAPTNNNKESSTPTNNIINNNNQNKVEIQATVSTLNVEFDLDDNSCFAQPAPTLKELAESDYSHNRQLAARKIFESLKQARSNEEEFHSVTAIMCKLIEDEEVLVRLYLMENITSIALHFQDDPFVKLVIRQQLIPCTVKLLSEIMVIPEVRKAGQSVLLVLLENNLIDNSQLTEWICPLVVQMVRCETNPVEVTVEDASFMTKMLPSVGKEITLKFFLEPYISLCGSEAFEIRKVCALGFGILTNIVGVETTESSLLPIFIQLCEDGSFGVRKACVDVFNEVAIAVSPKSREEILAQTFLDLLNDSHNHVICNAYKNLGEFIHMFANSNLSNNSKPPDQEDINASSSNTTVISTERSIEPEIIRPDNTAETECNIQKFSRRTNRFKLNYRRCRKECYGTGLLKKSSLGSEDSQEPFEKVTKIDTHKSPAIAAKDGHVYVHLNNENLFNNFQFWRLPIPEVELDIDIEPGKTTNIHVRAKVQSNEEIPESEIKVCVQADPLDLDSPSFENTSSTKRMLVQTACINKFSTRDEQSLLDDDSDLKQSFNESVLAFRDSLEPYMPEELTPVNQIIWDEKNVSNDRMSTDEELEKKKAPRQMTVFDQDIVPPALLNAFIKPVQSYRYSVVPKRCDDEMMECIAYSFPAVALTLGPKYWLCIKKTFELLAKNTKFTVRRIIASSLHELADILGYEIIMADLFPVFTDILKDVDEVRLRLVLHLSDFLKHLTSYDRKQFLPFIDDFTVLDSERNWRFRFTIAEQLKKTAELYEATEIAEYFFPIAASLLLDKVSAVRLAAVELVAFLLKRLYQDKRTESSFRSMFDTFDSLYRLSPKWICRQTYVRVCEELVIQESIPKEEYVDLIVPKLFSIAWDAVPNVRLAVIRCIVRTFLPMGMLPLIKSQNSSRELLYKVLDWMKYDTDNDVRHFAVMYSDSS